MKHYIHIMRFVGVMLVMVMAQASLASSVFNPWRAGTVVSEEDVKAYGEERCFTAEPISNAVFARMNYSYTSNQHIARTDLRYLRVLHRDLSGRILLGEMVCHKQIANELIEIFHALYKAAYPIGRMVLIDNYKANDEASMRANNTSCFCYRRVAGSNKVSAHGMGLAVDVNPLYNPYVKHRSNGTVFVQPANARQYTDRDRKFGYKIERGDLCYRLFIERGFTWGGAWRTLKDYQHFEKSLKDSK